jgi:hypothetical protein
MMRGFFIQQLINVNIPSQPKFEDDMDKALYERLRDILRSEQNESRTRRELVEGFLIRLAARVNQITGQAANESVCEWGSGTDEENFKPNDYGRGIDEFTFALRIRFFDEKQVLLFQTVVPFTAEISGDSITVYQDDKYEIVPRAECYGEYWLTEVAGLLDAPLREAVEGPPDPYSDE